MATITRGYSFGSTEQVTNSKLHSLVDSATITAIVNADIDASAAIAYSKLNISSAAINYSKLNLTGSIVNADISASAAIVGSKLDLSSPGNIGATSPGTGAFSTLKVGTTNQGDILYDNGTTFVRLTPGTSGQFLKTQGAGANPVWASNSAPSNVLFQYVGQVDQQGASAGEVVGTTLVPNAATGNYRFLQYNPGGTYAQIWSSKFIKIAGVSTVTVYARIWQRRALGSICNIKVDIGGANGNVSGTASQVTPEWKSFTIDVSGLSNGTAYDVTAYLKEPNSNSEILYCSDIIGFGS